VSARHVPLSPARHLPGRAELGQNLLVDRTVVTDVVGLVRDGRDPLVEWAAGDGAVTCELARLGRPLEAVEIDARRITVLRRRVGPHMAITHGDILRHAPPTGPHDLVCDVPFQLLVIRRRPRPLVPEREPYQSWVPAVFTGPGRGLPAVLAAAGGPGLRTAAWCRAEGLGPRALPRDLTAEPWVGAYRLSWAGRGRAPHGDRRRPRQRRPTR
jgi:23S rRNA (adenine-N6)-dimethyltransferase